MVKVIEKKERRKTYSLSPEHSRDISRVAIDMADELGKTVTKQSILEALVSCLKDRDVFTKVCNVIAKK